MYYLFAKAWNKKESFQTTIHVFRTCDFGLFLDVLREP